MALPTHQNADQNNLEPKKLIVKSLLYEKNFPYYQCPKEIGFFSLDGDRVYHADKSQLKYFCRPKDLLNVNMNLNFGYASRIKSYCTAREKLDNILKWILLNKKTIYENFKGRISSTRVFPVDFICYRGLLTKLLKTPFETDEDWTICASKFKKSIYLFSYNTPDRERKINSMSEKEEIMTYWGYKFEQYVTTDSPNGQPEHPETPINEREEYCSVLKGSLNRHSLLFCAEIDCIDTSKLHHRDDSTPCYAELKTSRLIDSHRQNFNFCRHKLMRWWAQSFLAGISEIHCGFRNDIGVVKCISTFPVSKIHRLAKDSWSPSICMNFCDDFLKFVKECAVKDDPKVVYKFDWKPGSDITCTELSSSEYQILPEWYLMEFS